MYFGAGGAGSAMYLRYTALKVLLSRTPGLTPAPLLLPRSCSRSYGRTADRRRRLLRSGVAVDVQNAQQERGEHQLDPDHHESEREECRTDREEIAVMMLYPRGKDRYVDSEANKKDHESAQEPLLQ